MKKKQKIFEVPKSDLQRDLHLTDAVGVGLGAIIGAGIFVVTGVAAGVAGAAFIIGLLLAGVAATCNALSSAELAATYPQSGGTYEYGYRLLNPVWGLARAGCFGRANAGLRNSVERFCHRFAEYFRDASIRHRGGGVYNSALLWHRQCCRLKTCSRKQTLPEMGSDFRCNLLLGFG